MVDTHFFEALHIFSAKLRYVLVDEYSSNAIHVDVNPQEFNDPQECSRCKSFGFNPLEVVEYHYDHGGLPYVVWKES